MTVYRGFSKPCHSDGSGTRKIINPLYSVSMGFMSGEVHKPVYFTLSDRGFLPRTLAMCKSLRIYDSVSPVYYFATEPLLQVEFDAFASVGVKVLSIEELLGTELVAHLRYSRSLLEFMWTLPSQLLTKMWELEKSCTDFAYLDADIFFYSDPGLIWLEIPSNSISIVRHNFSRRLQNIFIESGEFNVSWVSVPNSSIGMAVASKWASDCLEMCPDKPVIHNGKLVYGDQKYLDYWPELYGSNLHIIEHLGAGVAPWNYEEYKFSAYAPLLVNDVPLIFFHFSSHQFGFFLARRMGSEYSRVKAIPTLVYDIYEQALLENVKTLQMKKWRSRYRPLRKRAIGYITRKIVDFRG